MRVEERAGEETFENPCEWAISEADDDARRWLEVPIKAPVEEAEAEWRRRSRARIDNEGINARL